MHHPGYFEPSNNWSGRGKKQALNLRGKFYVPEEIITLLPNGRGKRFPLFHIPPYDINNQGETQHCGKVVEDPQS